jgi:tRNA threonylcarbamoyl adenosine modification protein YeaZ
MPPLILAVETSSRTGSVAIALGENLLAETKFAGPSRHSAELFPSICHLLDRFSRKPDQIEHIYISVGPGSFTGLRIAVTMAKTMSLANAAKIVAVDSLDVAAANIPLLIEHRLSADLSGVLSSVALAKEEAQAKSETSAKAEVPSIENLAVVVDAKRNQFFIAVYQKTQQSQIVNRQSSLVRRPCGGIVNQPTGYEKIVQDSLMTSDEFLEKFAALDQPIWLLGDGLLYYKDKFKSAGIRFFDEQYWSPRASKVHLLGWQLALAGRFSDPLTLTPNYLLRPDIKIKPR